MRAWLVFGVGAMATVALSWSACTRSHRLGQDGGSPSQGGSSSTGFVTDGAAICGNEVHHAVQKRPLIYLVLDRSGSMQSADPETGESRWKRVAEAALDMVDSLKSLVRVGLTLYPAEQLVTGCETGEQVYKPQVPTTSTFNAALAVLPDGGTPTAATLAYVRTKIAGEPNPKVVILATDGAPNCNVDATCSAGECTVNVDGFCPADITNCCDPVETGDPGATASCIDRAASVDAVQALVADGVNVYVVGVPGTEKYAGVLNQLALVGGVPQEGSTKYYRVDDFDVLHQVFKDIASSLISCSLDLTDPPAEPGKTNVYFDEEVVVQDETDGWVWVDEDTIELHGAACAKLKSGKVKDIQVVSGCPTATPQ